MSIQVSIHAAVALDPDSAFLRLADYASYPEHAATVRRVTLTEKGGSSYSTWEVDFRGGILRWTERDESDPVARVLRFEQVDGDLDRFDGRWEVHLGGPGSVLSFHAELDLGIPSLAPIVDPVARNALEENMRSILQGLFAGSALEVRTGAPVGLASTT